VAAFKAIKDKQAPFISRGDRSGTHQAELSLWHEPKRRGYGQESNPCEPARGDKQKLVADV
jgi:ABC-type tungstate transport system permease subunit